jgi:tetratricopeptide (TPR) repeat protein
MGKVRRKKLVMDDKEKKKKDMLLQSVCFFILAVFCIIVFVWQVGWFGKAHLPLDKNKVKSSFFSSPLLDSVRDLIGRKAYTDARVLLEQILLENKSDALVFMQAGKIFLEDFEIPDYEKALECYGRALKLDPKPWVYVALGNVYHHLDRSEEALNSYEAGLQIDPQNLNFYLGIGDVYMKKGDYDAARTQYAKVVEIDQENYAGYLSMAESYSKQEDNVSAEAWARKALVRAPNNAVVLNNLGEILRRQEKYAEALQLFKRGIKADPNNSHNYNGLGWIYLDQRDYLSARDMLLQSAKIDRFHCPYQGLGLVYHRLGDHARAEENFKKAIEQEPHFYRGFHNLAVHYLFVGDFEKVTLNIERARAHTLDSFAEHELLETEGMCALLQNDSVRAQSIFSKIETQFGRTRDFTLTGLAFLALAERRYAEAEALLLQAIDLNSEGIGFAFLGMARFNELQQRSEQAIVWYKKILDIEPASVYGLSGLHALLVRENKSVEAMDIYKQIIALAPRNDYLATYLKKN